MGIVKTLIFLKLTIFTAYIAYMVCMAPVSIPIVEDEFWGPSSERSKPEDKSIRDFKIQVDDKILTDLKSRLKLEIESKRVTPPLEGIGFEYGFNTKYLSTILTHWLDKYDWRAREKLLNKYSHYKTKIGGLDIHFQHVKGSSSNKNYKKTLPLLLLHGWPGSIVEFQKIIPLFTEPKGSQYNFELVMPSLPGYGFSQGSARPGLDTVGMANIFLRLMKRLGHDQFYIMGGDWGGLIVSDMASLYPKNILGSHSTMCVNNNPMAHLRTILVALFPTFLAEKEIIEKTSPLSSHFSFIMRETGYLHIQATKPDTVGVALSQSPSGLAAYILEKFSTWTNRKWINREDGGLLEKFTMDELLDNVMIYWVTNSITTSVRLYSEALDPNKKHKIDGVPIDVPCACMMMPEDLAIVSLFNLRDKYNRIEQYSIAKKGGHFGAFEVPEIVAEDVFKFFNKIQ